MIIIPKSTTAVVGGYFFLILVFRNSRVSATTGCVSVSPRLSLSFLPGLVFLLLFFPLTVLPVRGSLLISTVRSAHSTSFSSSLLSLARHSYVFDTRIGVGFVVGFTLIELALATLMATVSTKHSGFGLVLNMPGGIYTRSSSLSGLSLLVARASVLEPRIITFVVVSTSIRLSLVVLVSDVSSSVLVVGSVSNIPNGIGTISSSSGSLLECFCCFPGTFLTGKLRTV